MNREQDGEPGNNKVLWQRISDARWTLLAAFAVLGYAVFDNRLGAGFAMLASVFILSATLIVPRYRSSRALARRQVRTRSVWPDTGMKVAVDAFPLPCIVVDHKSIVRHGNVAASDLFGPIRPGDPLAYALRAPQVHDALDQVVGGGEAGAVEWREKVPADRVMEARFSPVYLPGPQVKNSPTRNTPAQISQAQKTKRPDFVIIAFFDLTELHQLDRMRADFVANASHELRTPLASLTGFIETLQGPARNDEKARDNFLAIMLEQSNRMGRLINDLLSLSRIEMKGPVGRGTKTDLRVIADHVVETMAPLAADLSVRIDLDLDAGPMPVTGDHDELVQVFANLVENALRYGASGGRVELSGHLKAGPHKTDDNNPGHYEMAIRDWGPGIAPEHLPRLTERFYRADIEKSRSSKGTGLGLAIVKHIVNRHGGRLQIKSTLGEGAVFSVILPVVTDSVAREASAIT